MITPSPELPTSSLAKLSGLEAPPTRYILANANRRSGLLSPTSTRQRVRTF